MFRRNVPTPDRAQQAGAGPPIWLKMLSGLE
jgi:hypothetical protein